MKCPIPKSDIKYFVMSGGVLSGWIYMVINGDKILKKWVCM